MMRPVRRRRVGIMIIEMVVVTGLATLLIILLATSWATFGRPGLEVEARARLEQEGILIAQSLACDLGGFLDDDPSASPGRTGGTLSDSAQFNPYQFIDWSTSNSNVLLLNFSSGTNSPAYTVSYQIASNQLVRTCTNLSTGASTTMTVARYVTVFSLQSVESNVQMTITLNYRNFTTTFTLIGVPPSP
jgi:hypothetical protein